MIQVTLDSEQSNKLRDAQEFVELCDPAGVVIGQFVPRFDPTKWEIVGDQLSDEELDRLANSDQKRYTTEEVLAHLRNLERA